VRTDRACTAKTHVSCGQAHAPEQRSDGLPHLGLCLAGTGALPQEQLDGELDVLVLRAYGKGAAVLKGSLLAPVERHLAHAQQLLAPQHHTRSAAAGCMQVSVHRCLAARQRGRLGDRLGGEAWAARRHLGSRRGVGGEGGQDL
jgi:hypothetical protein